MGRASCGLLATSAAVLLALAAVPAPSPAQTAAPDASTGAPRPIDDDLLARAVAALFRPALPGYRYAFPRDHAAHPEFQSEWWYYTGHLAAGSRRFGYELTFFQVGLNPLLKGSRSAWALHTGYFAHLALTDENRNRFRFTEQVSRPALGMAGASTDRYHVWMHDWSARLAPDGTKHRLRAAARDFGIELSLASSKPPVVHGKNGVSQKAEGRGRASHYYSLTRLETQGTLGVDGERLPVTGLSWMDHEFGSNTLTSDQAGWDWFSVQLADRRELMLYLLRRKDGSVERVSSGTLVEPDGRSRHLPLAAFQVRPTGSWTSPRTRGVYPAGWRVQVPGAGLDLELAPTVADQELVTGGAAGITYWEGSVRIRGTASGRPITGLGYVELTGYTGAPPGVSAR